MSNYKKTGIRVPLLLLLASISMLTGCNSTPQPVTHDVDYYVTHVKERQAMLVKCSKSGSTVDTVADCTNAATANLR